VHDSISTGSCPFCGVHEHADHDSARCLFGEGFLSDGLLETLHRVTAELPDVFSTTSLGDAPASATAWR
jgi:hypothetical protein